MWQYNAITALTRKPIAWIETLRPEVLGVIASLLCLTSYLIGGEVALLISALTLPVFGVYLARNMMRTKGTLHSVDPITGLRSLSYLEQVAQEWIVQTQTNHRKTVCFIIRIHAFPEFALRHGEAASEQAQRTIAARILRSLREEDLLARTREGEFMFLLTPVRHLDLEICIQLASRMKAAIEAKLPLETGVVELEASIGFCRSDQLNTSSIKPLVDAARMALRDARRNGNADIRAYTESLYKREEGRRRLGNEAARALQNGEIRAWYQPQISTETGLVTGFETLARWEHPQKGIISPAQFLETLAETGQLEHLAEFMLANALEAQTRWERQGFHVPQVGVNFAGDELRNPMLVDRIHWELDRFGLSPDRIAIEVLESVIADSPDGAIADNVNGLAKLGCYIDLDDFGTGHASISSIRRFAVSRLKIDRSFVMHVDSEPEQQKLVEAIVTMAERLGLETLAEGVETAGEHTMLAQLGCTHVQGYGIAHPMPFEQTIPWMAEHRASLHQTPEIGRRIV